MCKFESSQKDESRWQSTDSSKAYRNISALKIVAVSHTIGEGAWRSSSPGVSKRFCPRVT